MPFLSSSLLLSFLHRKTKQAYPKGATKGVWPTRLKWHQAKWWNDSTVDVVLNMTDSAMRTVNLVQSSIRSGSSRLKVYTGQKIAVVNGGVLIWPWWIHRIYYTFYVYVHKYTSYIAFQLGKYHWVCTSIVPHTRPTHQPTTLKQDRLQLSASSQHSFHFIQFQSSHCHVTLQQGSEASIGKLGQEAVFTTTAIEVELFPSSWKLIEQQIYYSRIQ